MGTDTKTHSHGAWGILCKSWGKDWETWRGQVLYRKTESTNLDHWRSHRLTQQPKSEHGLDLGPGLGTYVANLKLDVYASLPNNWSRGCFWICCLPVEPILLTGLLCLDGVIQAGREGPPPSQRRVGEGMRGCGKGDWEETRGLILRCKMNKQMNK